MFLLQSWEAIVQNEKKLDFALKIKSEISVFGFVLQVLTLLGSFKNDRKESSSLVERYITFTSEFKLSDSCFLFLSWNDTKTDQKVEISKSHAYDINLRNIRVPQNSNFWKCSVEIDRTIVLWFLRLVKNPSGDQAEKSVRKNESRLGDQR